MRVRILIIVISVFFLPKIIYAEKNCTIKEYFIKINLSDSLINIDLQIQLNNSKTDNFLLFNSEIKNYKIESNDSSFNYVHKNDTLYFNSTIDSLSLKLKYSIIWKKDGHSNNYPIKCDSNQIFFERYYKWYPLLYDNFSNFHLTASVPEKMIVFSYVTYDSIQTIQGNDVYTFNFFDEDIPILISKMDSYKCLNIAQNKVNFNFYFNKNKKRFLKIENGKPIFSTDSVVLDSINNFLAKRCVEVFDWYNTTFWEKDIESVNFIESSSPNMGGYGLNSLIYLTTKMINYDLCYKYQISHEIGHLWFG